ncbi:MAG: SUKH-3 immunity protein [Verrucomicrobia bacterium]|jgi:hypothetical protein|nr:MAG: SUKH-3 immunity protein [Verrucomicrobiota bacterium]
MEMVSTVSSSARSRFHTTVLAPLLDAGWHEGRNWESGRLDVYLSRFDTVFPPAAIRVLSEFGGLSIGFGGRVIAFGDIDEDLCASQKIIESLIGQPLFPVGTTNILQDDGLGVLMDESGQMFVDGATGDFPPRDYQLALIATDIDGFLKELFSGKPHPNIQSWHYSQSDL